MTFQPKFFQSDLFNLSVTYYKNRTQLLMTLQINPVNTREFPFTFELLQKFLPSILQSQCFNDEKNPFSKEVRQTEIGHLFEHILLEYLCLNKISLGGKKATYSGVTNWNWKKDRRGTFHIHINSGYKDNHLFESSLKQSIELINLILHSQEREYFPKPFSSFSQKPLEANTNL